MYIYKERQSEFKKKMISQIIVLAILILLNAFFAAAEMAFVSLNDAKISVQAKEGNKKAKAIEKMLRTPSKFLATIQIGITLAGFLSSAFASDAFADRLAPVLNSLMPMLSVDVWKGIAIIIITIILSYFTLIFGELVPKRLAMKNAEKIAFGSIGIIRGISIFAAPFVKFLTFSTDCVSKLFGVTETDQEVVTEEEIRMMIDVGKESGNIDESEREMINNVFEFNDRTVSEIMTHRTDIFAVDMNMTVEEFEELPDNFKNSRIPVYDETIDDIKGILHIKDLLKVSKGGKNKTKKLKTLINEAYFVPESKLINELFKELQKNKKQMAIIIDEYGGTAGLVTMEDILEELVGDIFDEYDDIEQTYEKIDENTYIIDGGIAAYDFKKIMGIDIPEGDYDTLSGYLIEELGRIPDEDEKPIIETEKATYKIEEYEDRRITKVKVCKNNVQDIEDKEEE